MILSGAIYSQETGIIQRIVTSSLEVIGMNAGPDEGVIIGDYDPRTQRVDVAASPHVVIPKTEQLQIGIANTAFSADGNEGLQLTGIEDGTMVTMPTGMTMEMLPEFGGDLEVLVDLPGEYSVTLSHPLYLDTIVEFTAT